MGVMIDRRQLLVACGGLALAGCAVTKGTPGAVTASVAAIPDRYRLMYGPLPNEPFPIPAVDLTKIDPVYFRQLVTYPSPEPAGTIVVDTGGRFLYLVREDGMALRYGIGIAARASPGMDRRRSSSSASGRPGRRRRR